MAAKAGGGPTRVQDGAVAGGGPVAGLAYGSARISPWPTAVEARHVGRLGGAHLSGAPVASGTRHIDKRVPPVAT